VLLSGQRQNGHICHHAIDFSGQQHLHAFIIVCDHGEGGFWEFLLNKAFARGALERHQLDI
jgi:hypothetical protein